jgi:hypothetical protein
MKGLILTKNDTLNSHFNVDDLFRFRRMAFIVEIALAKARKNDSRIQIKNEQDLFHVFTGKDTFTSILSKMLTPLKVLNISEKFLWDKTTITS